MQGLTGLRTLFSRLGAQGDDPPHPALRLERRRVVCGKAPRGAFQLPIRRVNDRLKRHAAIFSVGAQPYAGGRAVIRSGGATSLTPGPVPVPRETRPSGGVGDRGEAQNHSFCATYHPRCRICRVRASCTALPSAGRYGSAAWQGLDQPAPSINQPSTDGSDRGWTPPN